MTDQELRDLIYNTVLIVVHDGGKFAPYFHPNYNMASRHQVGVSLETAEVGRRMPRRGSSVGSKED